MVARDDLPDGGAAAVADTVAAVRDRLPGARVETLISDLGGDPDALQTVFDARPDVLNHNIETVARLQRAVRPSAGYARSLSVLARAAGAGLTTKSSIIAGMGESHDEVVQTLADLHSAGTDIVTIGQYLRPSARHLPVDRWWPPEAFDRWKEIGEAMGTGPTTTAWSRICASRSCSPGAATGPRPASRPLLPSPPEHPSAPSAPSASGAVAAPATKSRRAILRPLIPPTPPPTPAASWRP